jgi:hypothetical protein
MTWQESTIEEKGEPSLVFFRCASLDAPVELVIVDNGNTIIYRISDERAMRGLADLAHFMARRR